MRSLRIPIPPVTDPLRLPADAGSAFHRWKNNFDLKTVMEIRVIEMSGPEYPAVYELRDRVLRQPIGLSLDDEDLSRERSEFTLAAFDGEQLLGCVMLRPRPDGEMKLRQMAVYPEFQGRKVGAALVRAAEAFAREKAFEIMSLHARDYAVPFYEKSGYRIEGDGFKEMGIPHHLMLKKL